MSSIIVCLGYIGSILGLVQGIAWLALSLCGILLRFEAWVPQFDYKTYQQNLSAAIIHMYLDEEPKLPWENVIVTGDGLVYFLFLYVVLSTAWVIVSLCMMLVFLRKKDRFRKTIIPVWGGCTCLISLLDLILTTLLGIDYSQISDSQTTSFITLIAAGTMMTIAARGFVLWIVNVVVTTVLLVLQNQAKDEISDILRHHIDAYENTNAARHGNNNYGFEWDDKPDKKTAPDIYPKPSQPTVGNPTGQPKNNQPAQVGKSRGKAIPTKVAAPKPPKSFLYPKEPTPDYSPEMERRNDPMRSALKNRSQNLYGTQM